MQNIFTRALLLALVCSCQGKKSSDDKPPVGGGEHPTCNAEGLSLATAPAAQLRAGTQMVLDFQVCSGGQLFTKAGDLAGASLQGTLRGAGCDKPVLVEGWKISFAAPDRDVKCQLETSLSYQGKTFQHQYPFTVEGQPLPTPTETLTIAVTPDPAADRTLKLEFSASAGARLFDADHSDHILYKSLLKKGSDLGLEFQEGNSLDINVKTWKVKVPGFEKRKLKADHSYKLLFDILTSMDSLVAGPHGFSKDKLGLNEDPDLPALIVDKKAPISTWLPAVALCFLPLFDPKDIPEDLLATEIQNLRCQESAAKATREMNMNFSLESFREVPRTPEKTVLSLSEVAMKICDFGIDPSNPAHLARLQQFKDKHWVSADADQTAARADCRYYFMTRILPNIVPRVQDAALNFKSTLPYNTLLRTLLQDISEVTGTSEDPATVLKRDVLMQLVDADWQNLPAINPQRDFNAKAAADVLQKTAGAWDKQDELYAAILDVPAITALKSDVRQRLIRRLGPLYVSNCNPTMPISTVCVQQSASALVVYTIKGLTQPDPVGIGNPMVGP